MTVDTANQKGAVLIMSLFVLVVLTAIGIFATNRAIVEGWISANYRTSQQAFYIAEAGIEFTRAHHQFNADGNWSDGITGFSPPMTRQIGEGGNFTVTFPPGPPGTPPGAATQNEITVRSVGTIAGATSVVEARVTRSALSPPAALSFVGDVGVDLDGQGFRIDGGLGKRGITMGFFTPDDTQSPSSIRDDLRDENQADQVMGSTPPNPSVAGDNTMTQEDITKFANAMARKADTTIRGSYVTYTGDFTHPRIVYIEAAKGEDLTGRIEGAGTLVIRGNDFDFDFEEGTIDWKGLVIITGRNIGGSLGGSLGNRVKIHGALIISDIGEDEPWEWVGISGNTELIYNQSYLDAAQQTMLATVSSWRHGVTH